MKNKIKSMLLCLLCLSMLLSGCGGNQNGDENTDPTGSTNANIDAGAETSPSAPIYNFDEIEEIKIDEYIWDKNHVELEQTCVSLTGDWKNSICVGGASIFASTFTDVSVLPNYFVDEYNIADIETAYRVQEKGFELKKEGVQFGDYVRGSLTVVASTWGKNLIVEEVRYTVNANPYVGGLDDLKANAKYSNSIGAGSAYSNAIALLGKPTSEEVMPMMEGYEQICAVYDTDNVNLTLIFIKSVDGSKDDGLLVTIYWRADALREVINTEVAN